MVVTGGDQMKAPGPIADSGEALSSKSNYG